MRKSSTPGTTRVKQRNAKVKEQLTKLFDVNVQDVVSDGVGDYVRSGTRLLLELLMDAEAKQYCGER